MGLSRRRLTREVKLATVPRLETGSTIAEVARAFEVNPNVLHRCRREFRQGPGTSFRVSESAAGRRRNGRSWSARLGKDTGDRFLKKLLATHRGAAHDAGIDWKAGIHQKIQKTRSKRSGHERGAPVRIGPREPGRLLPVSEPAGRRGAELDQGSRSSGWHPVGLESQHTPGRLGPDVSDSSLFGYRVHLPGQIKSTENSS